MVLYAIPITCSTLTKGSFVRAVTSRPLSRKSIGHTGLVKHSPFTDAIPSTYREAFGEWLKEKRLAAGLRQQDVSDVLGVGITTISGMEVGRISVPPARYEEYADMLGVDRVEFVKECLRFSNPWAYLVLFGDPDGRLALALGKTPKPRPKRGA